MRKLVVVKFENVYIYLSSIKRVHISNWVSRIHNGRENFRYKVNIYTRVRVVMQTYCFLVECSYQ